ncbi:helix-turn-helix domain-containing protein [Mediterraneibacter agrestimuris]|uniref:helix-turn-helix domain-containing protein n=1 Tax=Mediterraneibacter agrestimuris TaxID=2941333 RepID=UPI002041EF91|nr:helix-turn-helix transcriptional regulator [Mediterraneibacter agrestimuris]
MYEIYCKLRDAKGLKDANIAKATGITKSTFSDWKNGRSKPKDEKLQKIADYFDVTIDYLMTGEEKEGDKYYINEETAEMAQKLFENKDLRVLFDAAQDATPEDLKTTYDMLMALKRKERGENEF